jgi:hypothetical protein
VIVLNKREIETMFRQAPLVIALEEKSSVVLKKLRLDHHDAI